MTTVASEILYDVFVSYATPEAYALTAATLHSAFKIAGLTVFDSRLIEEGSNLQDTIWNALAYSSAVLAVASDSREMSANAAVELGAAMGWHKPIFVLLAGSLSAPAPLAHFQAVPLSRLDDVIRSVRQTLKPMADAERQRLSAAYLDLGVPTDRLIREPTKVEELARRFNRGIGNQISGERLVQELLRMRKRGELPRVGR